MKKNRLGILVLANCLCFFACAFAETIVLKSGKTVEGKLIEKTDKYIKIDFYGVALTYFFDEIKSIDGENIIFTRQSKESAKDNIGPIQAERVAREGFDNDCFEKVKQAGLDGVYQYETKANFQEAIRLLNGSLELCKKCFPLSSITPEERKKALELYVPIYMGLSGSYFALGEPSKSVSICEEAVKALPEYSFAFNDAIAAYYASRGEYQKAIDICKNTLQLFPESATTYHALGRIYYKMGDYQKSKESLRESLRILRVQGYADSSLAQEGEKILKSIPGN